MALLISRRKPKEPTKAETKVRDKRIARMTEPQLWEWLDANMPSPGMYIHQYRQGRLEDGLQEAIEITEIQLKILQEIQSRK